MLDRDPAKEGVSKKMFLKENQILTTKFPLMTNSG